jgi:hypothetical protein
VTRVIVWKELREQLAILIALAALGAGIITAGATLGDLSGGRDPLDFRGYGEPARLAATVLVCVAGLVVGGTLFAGEFENGTAGFLMHLPATRRRLWSAKLVAGIALTLGMSLVLAAVSYGAGVFTGSKPLAWALWFCVLGLAAFAAGAFGSAAVRQVLPACGIGIAAGPTVAALCASIGIFFLRRAIDDGRFHFNQREVSFFITLAGPLIAAVVMAVMSFLVFTYPDYARKRHVVGPGTFQTAVTAVRTVRTPPSRFGVRALAWFVGRTWFAYAIVLHVLALLFGITLIIPGVPALFLWPGLTVFLGVLAGVFGFVDEQLNGVNRFWAERSLPPGRLWVAKVLAGSGVLLTSLGVVAVPLVIVTAMQGQTTAPFLNRLFGTGLVGPGFPFVTGLFLWPAYGFAAGLLAGMCFQKPLVSVAVGLMTGAATAAMWIPSLFSGGLMGWQVWPAAFVTILMTRFLMRDWALGRIAKGHGLVKLAATIVTPLALISGGVLFRFVDVPLCPEVEDDIRFSETLPTTDETQPGRDLKRAVAQFATRYEQANDPAEKFFGPAYERPAWSNSRGAYSIRVGQQMSYVSSMGYPTDRPDFDRWLKEVFGQSEWLDELKKMRGRPPGVFLDPNDNLTVFSRIPELEQYRHLTTAVIAKGLHDQTYGDPASAVDRVAESLTAVRTARHDTILMGTLIARQAEATSVLAVERWLERLDHDPIHLKRMLAVLREHATAPPENPNAPALADQVMLRNAVRNPQTWYPEYARQFVNARGLTEEDVRQRADAEATFLQFCWTVPWEKERLRRAVGLRNAPAPPPGIIDRLTAGLARRTVAPKNPKAQEANAYLVGMPGLGLMEMLNSGTDTFRLVAWENDRLARLRLVILAVALRLHEADHGQPAATLDELVPDYLPAVPTDPHSPEGKPFRYELSRGDRVVYMEEVVPPGPMPGTDGSQAFTRDQFYAMAAAGGAIAASPLAAMPLPVPGFDPARPFSDEEYEALIALVGGTLLWPNGYHESVWPGPVSATREQYFPDSPGEPVPANPVAAAGMGGPAAASLVGVVSFTDAFGEERNPAGRYLGTMIPRDVPKGQGIVWGVGPDTFDDGGIWLTGRGSNRGDLIVLVPPAVKWIPPTGDKP